MPCTTEVPLRTAAAGRVPGSSVPVARIRAQYEAWPYPHAPLVGRIPRHHTWQLNQAYLADRCGVAPAPVPRIWVAGCGTLQPYVMALANPGASILCSDLSRASLRAARRRCRWHGARGVELARVDLEDPASWPAGPFDLIECYGVLMNLSNPARTLAAMAERLAPSGVLRLMVYPHYSRQRIFQIQRLARLLGLHAGDRRHPARLRAAVRRLPRAHPLRYTFDHYADARSDAGLVDGFLHASDHGFRGLQLGALLRAAGLRPAFWFHRPWGQPGPMAEALGLAGRGQSFVLHYLDLWQELRTNFVVCAVRGGAEPAAATPRVHPLLDPGNAALGPRDRLRAWSFGLLGATLPCRTADQPMVLPARAVRAAWRGDARSGAGAVVGARAPVAVAPPHEDGLVEPTPWAALRLGAAVPNPLYAPLFECYTMAQRWPAARLAPLAEQVERWRPHAAELENGRVTFGLTPHATYLRHRAAIDRHLGRDAVLPVAASHAELRLPDDGGALRQARAYVATVAPGRLAQLDRGALRELWLLVFSYDRLFLDLDAA